MIIKMKISGINFETKIRPYIPRIKQLALKLSGNQSDAEDLIQESFIKIFPKLDQLDEEKNVKAWIARVIYNTYVDIWRKQRKENLLYLEDFSTNWEQDAFEIDSSAELCPSVLLEINEQQRKITTLLYQLNNSQRILLILHDIEGYTINELAEVLDLPTGTIKSRLHRSRKRLREMIDEQSILRSEFVA